MTYVKQEKFRMHFKPVCNCRRNTINVFPDFVPPNTLRIAQVIVNGQRLSEGQYDPNYAQITFTTNNKEKTEIEVVFEPID